jgi:hypothetical protein
VRTFQEAFAHAREGSPFSNGTEGEVWTYQWCGRCLREAPYRSGLKGSTGCPLILVALSGRTPSEWLEQRDENGLYSMEDQYHCIEFRGPGEGGGEPKPRPEPPDMDGLFPRPEKAVRMLMQPQGALTSPTPAMV